MNVQYKKGVLELCVLCMLAREDRYGFDLVSEISRSIAMSEGTIYPLLKRLRDEGNLTTFLRESSEGPPRKYYRLTEQGRALARSMKAEWEEFVRAVARIIQDEGEESA